MWLMYVITMEFADSLLLYVWTAKVCPVCTGLLIWEYTENYMGLSEMTKYILLQ